MGQTFMGSQAQQTGTAKLMTPEQLKYLQTIIPGLTPQAFSTYQNLIGQPYSEETFQKGVVDPAMKTYEQQILPTIQERFIDANAGSSSALNQAIAQSAGDLSNTLAGQRINYQQMTGQQQLGALGQILQLINSKSFEPIVQGPQAGLLKDIISSASQMGAAYMLSSKDIKNNVKSYDKGLDITRNLEVKQYDYTIPVEGKQNNRVGLIAEDLPEELSGEMNGIKAVDLYGLVSVLVNSVKQLDKKMSDLEERWLSYSKA